MTSIINADTSGGLKITSDTSGALDIQSAGTNKLSMDSSGNISLAGNLAVTGLMPAGSIMQVVGEQETSAGVTSTSTSYVTFSTAPSFAITPAATSSKILVHMRIGMQYDATGQIENTIYRAIAGGATTELSGGTTYGISFHGTSATSGIWKETVMTFLDTPNTTAAVTYTWYSRSESGALIYGTHAGAVNSTTLMEIAQ